MRALGIIRAVSLTLAFTFLSASLLLPQEKQPEPAKKDTQDPKKDPKKDAKKEQDPPKPGPGKKQDEKWEDF